MVSTLVAPRPSLIPPINEQEARLDSMRHSVAMNAMDWAQRLGDSRRARDEAAAQLTESQRADAADLAAISTERWVTIVAAIRRHIEAYNGGARHAVLNVTEQSGARIVTVAAGGEGTPYLTATLDGNFISMKARDALGIPHATEFTLRPDRGDDATAAYLLQNWMERL